MSGIKGINGDQAMLAIKDGEFGIEVTASKRRVVVIMTQSWCPQWRYMSNWLDEMTFDPDLDIYTLEYDTVDYFNQFMRFKESKWGNYEVPYLRFYKDGVFVSETNYIGKKQFQEILNS